MNIPPSGPASLEQLRRDAKRLLKSARAGDPDAVRRLPADSQLADAQLIIAREQGYLSWPRVVRDLERFAPVEYADVDWRKVDRATVCCFRYSGELIMVETPPGYRLPAGDIEPSEDVLLDAGLRIPLEVAGFRRQGTHLVAISADRHHVVVWVDGNRYHGQRSHNRNAIWWTGAATEAADLLRKQGDGALAHIVELADHDRRTITDEQLAADSRRILDPSYLQATTAEGGSGYGGTPEDWRAAREQVCDAIEQDGTFLDIGCANGLLMESVVRWSAERGHKVEPYGVDHSPALVARAKERLPHWADRIHIGDVLTWKHPDGMRFDLVAVMTDILHQRRHAEMIKHLLDIVVARGGRLLLNGYSGDPELSGARVLRRNGYQVDGETSLPSRGRPDDQRSAWVINR